MRRRVEKKWGLSLIVLLSCASALAQEYPEKAVQVVLPLQVGSASDIAVRVVAERIGAAREVGDEIVRDDRRAVRA